MDGVGQRLSFVPAEMDVVMVVTKKLVECAVRLNNGMNSKIKDIYKVFLFSMCARLSRSSVQRSTTISWKLQTNATCLVNGSFDTFGKYNQFEDKSPTSQPTTAVVIYLDDWLNGELHNSKQQIEHNSCTQYLSAPMSNIIVHWIIGKRNLTFSFCFPQYLSKEITAHWMEIAFDKFPCFNKNHWKLNF